MRDFFYYRKFINNNNLIFSKYRQFYNNDSEILVEFNSFHNSHISLSYLSNLLSQKYKSSISAFFNYSIISSPIKNTLINEIKWKLGNFFSIKTFGIYRSFGAKKIFRPKISEETQIISEKYLKKIFSKLKNKKDVLKIRFDNILVGDLIYDTYLKRFVKPTIDINDSKFYDLVKNFLYLYFFWKSYFKEKNVKAVIGVHTPYSYGLILRLAISKNIPTYATSSRFLYSLTKKMPYMHGQFKDFKKHFQNSIIDLKKRRYY